MTRNRLLILHPFPLPFSLFDLHTPIIISSNNLRRGPKNGFLYVTRGAKREIM